MPTNISTQMPLAQPLVEHPAGDLGEPVEEPGEDAEHGARDEHVVEVRHDPVGVLDVEVERHDGQERAIEAADQEERDEAEREEHRRPEDELAAPHRGQPVEELDPGRHRDQEGEEQKKGRKTAPVVNMWCAQTEKPSAPIEAVAKMKAL